VPQQGPSVTLVGADIRLQGAGLSVLTSLAAGGGPDGNITLPVKNVSFAGALVMAQGSQINVGPAIFKLQRAMQWTYNKTSGNFTTRVAMSGSGTVTIAPPGQAAAIEGAKLECVISGDMDLQAAAFPGGHNRHGYRHICTYRFQLCCLRLHWHCT
jgi:hypothetical protein